MGSAMEHTPSPSLLLLLPVLSLLLMLSYSLDGHPATVNGHELGQPLKPGSDRGEHETGRGLEGRTQRAEGEAVGEGEDGDGEGEAEGRREREYSVNDGRIIGGQLATISQQPFQVSIRKQFDGEFFHHCGGILVHPQYVVTAAHCMFEEGESTANAAVPASDFELVLGSASLLTGGQKVLVTKIWTHPDYFIESSGVLVNDVALMKLARWMAITASITPIKIAFSDRRLKRFSDIAISGFGVNDTFSFFGSDDLLAATVDYLPAGCDGYENFNPKVMLCAGCEEGRVDTCTGDSGGPATTSSASGGCPILVGVTSFGRDCAEIGFPGVYTRISGFLDWLEKQAMVSFRTQYDILPTRYCDRCIQHRTLSCGVIPPFNASRCQLEAWAASAFKFVLTPCSTNGPNRLSVARVEASFSPSSFGSFKPSGDVYFLQGRPGGTRLVSIGGVRVVVPMGGKVLSQKGRLVRAGVWSAVWQSTRQRLPTRACTRFYSYVAVFVSKDRRIVQASVPAAYSAAN